MTTRVLAVVRVQALALVVPVALAAQEQSSDTARVTPVIVTATRLPLAQGALPVAVTVITGDELRARGVTTVADAIQSVTSAYVAQAGSPGATTSLFLRGGESKYVKVLIDGVPANDPGGAYDFASLTTDNVERIEIVRGPASVLYGADAVTGVVQVITRRPSGPTVTDVELSVGAAPRDPVEASSAPRPMQLVNAFASAGGSADIGALTGSYSFALAHHGSTGLYELNNAARDNVVSARAAVAAPRGTELRVALRFTDHKYNYPTTGGGTPTDSNAFFADDRTIVGVEAEHGFGSRARATLALSSSVTDGGTDDELDAPGGSRYVSHDRVRRRGAELRVRLLPSSMLAVTLGAQLEHQDQRSRAEGAFGGSPFTSAFTADRHNGGVYGEAVASAGPSLTITVGGRVDDNEQFGTFNTGRVGVSWRPLAATRLRATAGTAFREPTFAENFASGYVTGNPSLQPERTRSVDAGVDQELGAAARVSATVFAQRFTNMIDFTFDPSSCGYSYCNVAEARANGVEADVETRLAGGFGARVGATFLRTKVLSPGFDTTSAGLYRAGESLIRRPERKADVELRYSGASGLSASTRVLFLGARTDRNFDAFPATPVVLPAYQRVDLGAEYLLPLGARARTQTWLTLRVENLQNTGYQSIYGFPAPRRAITIGVRARM